MKHPIRTSAEAFEEHIPGEILKERKAQSSEEVFVQILSRRQIQESVIIPAVPEPLIVWIMSGEAIVEERPLGGEWLSNSVRAGDFFLTTALEPTELRWRADGKKPFQVMHVYVGLALLRQIVAEVLNKSLPDFSLREVSGETDEVLSELLGYLSRELHDQKKPSAAYIQGLAQMLTVHLVRTYETAILQPNVMRGGLPAFKLHRVFDVMRQHLAEAFNLERLAQEAGLSEFHFSRVFKQATGMPPSRYFIRLRMEQAKRLLCETDASIIDICLAIGYSSPSHFSQIFKKETGVAPSDYRGS
ncbi:helix-turn-helix domain-containing protein [Herbaspirillum sp. RV1423]|uniref:helix-turn-helix domain-containing protein n=1 Tax=Herbaspirillum sp. RV1423 TaxID=1443993 RepID=UPI00054E5CCD|nr:AraC family transcriptional regulator [Herbaspirillum sp. RV1423]